MLVFRTFDAEGERILPPTIYPHGAPDEATAHPNQQGWPPNNLSPPFLRRCFAWVAGQMQLRPMARLKLTALAWQLGKRWAPVVMRLITIGCLVSGRFRTIVSRPLSIQNPRGVTRIALAGSVFGATFQAAQWKPTPSQQP
jgi:hypothetical protein